MEFSYQAANARGRTLDGRITAANRAEAMSALRRQGLVPLHLAEAQASSPRTRRGKGHADVLAFTQQMATLTQAGLQLDRALSIVADLFQAERLGATVGAVRRDVREGAAFSAALARHPRLFNRIYINLVRASETGGVLPQVLQRLAQTLEEEKELRAYVLGALLYPAFVAVASLCAVLVLLIWVIPSFEKIFAQLHLALPAITRTTIWFSHALKSYGLWLAGGIAAALAALARLRRNEALRLAIDRAYLRLPLFGDLYVKMLTARMARTLAMLIGTGVPVLQAWNVVQETVKNRVVTAALKQAGQEIREGGGIARRLEAQDILPRMAIQMIAVGEETGELPQMLDQVARGYDGEVHRAIRNLLSLLEPVLILVLTAMTFLIALSILIPVVSLTSGL